MIELRESMVLVTKIEKKKSYNRHETLADSCQSPQFPWFGWGWGNEEKE